MMMKNDWKCNICQDRGIVLDENNIAHICSCQRQKYLERLFESSHITPAFRSKSFDNFVVTGRPQIIKEMLKCAKRYAKQFDDICDQENNWLAFLGQPGSGKTHLLIAIANDLLGRGRQLLYFQHVEGFTELRRSLADNSDNVPAKVIKIKKAPVLLWDDFFKGRETPTPWVLEVTFEIINYRYLNCLPTLFSSERLPEELLKIDAAIGSRILERAKKRTVVVTDQEANYRLR